MQAASPVFVKETTETMGRDTASDLPAADTTKAHSVAVDQTKDISKLLADLEEPAKAFQIAKFDKPIY